jgi:hypothetical protein
MRVTSSDALNFSFLLRHQRSQALSENRSGVHCVSIAGSGRLMERDEEPVRLGPVGQIYDEVPHIVQLQADLTVTNFGDEI